MFNKSKICLLLVLMPVGLAGCSNSRSQNINSMSRPDQVKAMHADLSKMPADERARIDAAMANIKSTPRPVGHQ
jgi:hypothetical protein